MKKNVLDVIVIIALGMLALLLARCQKSASQASLNWSSDFEGGAARDVFLRTDGSVAFSIPYEPGGNEYLWFSFRIVTDGKNPLNFVLENAAGAHQSGERWDITRPVVSRDGKSWQRCAVGSYGKESSLSQLLSRPTFRFGAPFAAETLYVAYCYPYAEAELNAFIRSLQMRSEIEISDLGRSEEGREIPLLTLRPNPATDRETTAEIWVICREHPGETPASFVCEGFTQAVLDQPAGQRLRDRFSLQVAPLLNVDGAARGNYYHNSQGVNLARDWVDFASAEVRALRAALEPAARTGRVNLVVNLHASNDPDKGCFFLTMPARALKPADFDLQQGILACADGNHPQLQGKSTVELLPLRGITGNALYRDYGIYCLYLESNYSRGADGSLMTPESLRGVGAALLQALAEVFTPE